MSEAKNNALWLRDAALLVEADGRLPLAPHDVPRLREIADQLDARDALLAACKAAADDHLHVPLMAHAVEPSFPSESGEPACICGSCIAIRQVIRNLQSAIAAAEAGGGT